jgi:hypothetical protein
MKSYQSPKAALANLSNHAFKMQASGEALAQISCGAPSNTSCSIQDRGAFCNGDDSASALIFLPGTNSLSSPNCVLIVDGQIGAQCETNHDDTCEGGANWNVFCDDNFHCQIEPADSIQIQCDGFETSDCGFIT